MRQDRPCLHKRGPSRPSDDDRSDEHNILDNDHDRPHQHNRNDCSNHNNRTGANNYRGTYHHHGASDYDADNDVADYDGYYFASDDHNYTRWGSWTVHRS